MSPAAPFLEIARGLYPDSSSGGESFRRPRLPRRAGDLESRDAGRSISTFCIKERTKEIGIWKAVGASDRQVMRVFLMEATVVSITGALVGLGLARLLMIGGNVLGRRVFEWQTALLLDGEIFIMPLWILLIAPSFAFVVGILAALYPARRSAELAPVEALRYE